MTEDTTAQSAPSQTAPTQADIATSPLMQRLTLWAAWTLAGLAWFGFALRGIAVALHAATAGAWPEEGPRAAFDLATNVSYLGWGAQPFSWMFLGSDFVWTHVARFVVGALAVVVLSLGVWAVITRRKVIAYVVYGMHAAAFLLDNLLQVPEPSDGSWFRASGLFSFLRSGAWQHSQYRTFLILAGLGTLVALVALVIVLLGVGSVQLKESQTPVPSPPDAAVTTWAIASIVWAFLAPLLGLIFAVMAKRTIDRTGAKGAGLAKAGGIISAVGLAVGLLALAVGLGLWQAKSEGRFF